MRTQLYVGAWVAVLAFESAAAAQVGSPEDEPATVRDESVPNEPGSGDESGAADVSSGAAPADGGATPATDPSPAAELPEPPEPTEPTEAEPDEPELSFKPFAYVETFFGWSFQEPDNGVIAFRGFDNRHATITLANVALGARLDYDRAYAQLTLQWGHTPASYYQGETSIGVIAGTGASDIELWRVLQEAYVGWNIPVFDHGLRLEGGLFLSTIGIEAMAVAQNWNFSRSNLFYGLPFYHTGIRATLPLDAQWSVTASLFNGWNTVLDNNDEKSVHAMVTYESDVFAATLQYFGGVERDPGDAERGWRSLFDLTARVRATEWLDVQAQVDAGFEPWSDATYGWFASALYVRVRPLSWMDVALRGDFFYDGAPVAGGARRSPIFWPAEWVSSGTATLTVRPIEQLALMIDYRHDEAAGPMYFAGEVALDVDGQPIADAVRQDTLTVALVGHLR